MSELLTGKSKAIYRHAPPASKSQETLISVAIPAPLGNHFSYLPPPGLNAGACPIGARVWVPFGSRKVLGIITDHTLPDPQANYKLRAAERLIDDSSLMPESLWQLSCWSARYYHEPLGSALYQILPKKIREGASIEVSTTLFSATVQSMELANHLLKNAAKQKAALEHLIEHGSHCSQTLQLAGFPNAVLEGLTQKGLVKKSTQPKWQNRPMQANVLAQIPLSLNEEQSQALNDINNQGDFKCFVLDGVTGSGKTEVYLQAISQKLLQGKQVLVLLPEINLTPQTLERFKQRFSVSIAIYHSQLNDTERFETWLKAKAGAARIIIGTRSAVFIPLKQPGLIIVDEEHDSSFKQQELFRYHGRDTAIYRAKLENTPIVLGSATPSLETLFNAQTGRFAHLKLSQRPTGHQPPQLEFIDIRGQQLKAGLSQPVVEAIKETLDKKQQVLVFLNRRGFAPVMICYQCGQCLDCKHCNSHLTWHKTRSILKCHHCLEQQPKPDQCPTCGHANLKLLGQGTERVEENLQQLFPDVATLRVDRDTTTRKAAIDQLRRQINLGDPTILVGTQMLAKGHHFPHVALSVILNADSGLLSIDFRGTEKLAQLIIQVAGRSGRGLSLGRVILQTLQPEHPLFQQLTQAGYAGFANKALTERAQAHMPPFSYHSLIRAEAKRAEEAHAFLSEIKHSLSTSNTENALSILGPVSAPQAKRAGFYRFQLLIQSQSRNQLHTALHKMHEGKGGAKKSSRVRWSIDIDPIDLY